MTMNKESLYMVRVILSILLFSFIFAELRVGHELKKSYDQRANGEKFSGNIDKTLVFGYDTPSFGFEYVPSDLEVTRLTVSYLFK